MERRRVLDCGEKVFLLPWGKEGIELGLWNVRCLRIPVHGVQLAPTPIRKGPVRATRRQLTCVWVVTLRVTILSHSRGLPFLMYFCSPNLSVKPYLKGQLLLRLPRGIGRGFCVHLEAEV